MMTKKILTILLFGLFCLPSFSQNIVDDVDALLKSIESFERVDSLRAAEKKIREQIQALGKSGNLDTIAMINAMRKTADEKQSRADSIEIASTSDIMSVLYTYDQSNLEDSIVIGTWEELRNHYAQNPLIVDLLGAENFNFSDTVKMNITQAARKKDEVEKAAPRQNILKQMESTTSASPADYLAVSSTLEKYRTPSFPPMQAMRIAAESSNQNISNGLVTQAAIIEGLFRFILDRAKDEVIINFLDRLLDEETPHLQKIFPTVVTEFKDVEFIYSSTFMGRLRQAFYEDVQKMSVRLPLLMLTDEYFEPLQAEPVAYNFLALYSMVGLSNAGMEVEEVMPVTHRFLFQNFEEKTKELNFILADSAHASPEFQQLIAQSESAYLRIKDIFQQLNNAEYQINDTLTGTRIRLQNLGVASADIPNMPDVNDFLKRSYDLNSLLNPKDSFGLNFLPHLLRGHLAPAQMKGYNTIESYDRFFGESHSPIQWRAAGLELAQKLSGTWYDEFSLPQFLRNWRKDLAAYQLAATNWREKVDTTGAFMQATQVMENNRKALQSAILKSRSFWAARSKPLPNDTLAFSVLANLISEKKLKLIDEEIDLKSLFNPEQFPHPNVTKLIKKRKLLVEVEDRFKQLDDRLYASDSTVFNVSPYRQYLASKQTLAPFATLSAKINDLETNLAEIKKLLQQLGKKQYAKTAAESRNNAKPIIQLTGLSSNLLFCLLTKSQDSTSSKWLTKPQLNSLLDGGKRQTAFLGLVQQRLSQTENIGLLSPNGLADLTRLTIKDLKLLQADTSVAEDSLAFYRKASFAVNTLNRLLELPLLVNPANPLEYQPLIDRSEKLKSIPQISDQALDFIYYLNIKDHSKALSSLIRLFTSLDAGVEGNYSTEDLRKKLRSRNKKKKSLKKEIVKMEGKNKMGTPEYQSLTTQLDSLENEDAGREYAILYLQKYGDFIAGLIDARSTNEVEEILRHASDPPGSSRIKRSSPFTVGINSFLGGTVGTETWERDTMSSDFVSLAPTMPVGIAMSWLTKKNQSWSIYVSLLDVGSLLTYRPNENNFGDTDFTFKNVFKPGAQLQYNIKNSPFYLGAGWQRGPQFQNINGEQTSFTSNRYFFGFGVDVPIKTLYQR